MDENQSPPSSQSAGSSQKSASAVSRLASVMPRSAPSAAGAPGGTTAGGAKKMVFKPTIPVRPRAPPTASQTTDTADKSADNKKGRRPPRKQDARPSSQLHTGKLTGIFAEGLGGAGSSAAGRKSGSSQKMDIGRQAITSRVTPTGASGKREESPPPLDDSAMEIDASFVPTSLMDTVSAKSETKDQEMESAEIRDESTFDRYSIFQFPPYILKDLEEKLKEMDADSTRGSSGEQLGEIIVRQSGKIEFLINGIVMEISPGTNCGFPQQVVQIDSQAGHAHCLSSVAGKYVIQPDVDSLLTHM